MSDFSNSTNSKYYDNSNKLVIGKIKDKTRGVTIDKFCWRETKNIFIFSGQNWT